MKTWLALAGVLVAVAGCAPHPPAPSPSRQGGSSRAAAREEGGKATAQGAPHPLPPLRSGEGKTARQSPAAPAATVPQRADWSVPKRYVGKLVASRVRFFPDKLVALTFDDGPDPAVTPRVLATLAAYHAHATFFVIGSHAKLHPELVKREAEEGHVVGNHSFTHPAHPSAAQATQELSRTAQAILQATNRKPTCFRPPYGIVKNALTKQALSGGYCVFTWTDSSADTAFIRGAPIGPEVIAHNVIHTPNPGEIILMHDGPGHHATAEALPRILKELSAAGFRFVTLPDLLRAWEAWLRTNPKPPANQ